MIKKWYDNLMSMELRQCVPSMIIGLVIIGMLTVGVREFKNQRSYINTLEQNLNEQQSIEAFKIMTMDEIYMLKQKYQATNNFLIQVNHKLDDYINKHEFDHDIDLVLSKAELHLYIEEQVKKFLESDGE